MSRMTMYSLDILLFLFGTSLLSQFQFYLLLPDMNTGFSRGMSGGLVFQFLSEFSNYYRVAFISYATKLMVKIIEAMLQQYINQELPDIRVGFPKGRATKIKLPTSAGSWKKQESFRKTSISALLTMP